ncbi:endogenous retroviral envelope protein HEMO-like [Panthera leo]|uniref:endogenous retroviral envelope protein HEMO-like n=1 Tax=Panthera leo TaxID=9689 RepID=UPI001C695D5F|nr:endogenous retroviral envelope protein HEMO-like [Panthera leo]
MTGYGIHDQKNTSLLFLVSKLYTRKPLQKLKDRPLFKDIRRDLSPLSIENCDGTGLFPPDIPRQYYNQTLWCTSTGSILKPLVKVRNGLNTYWLLQYRPLPNHQILQLAHKPPLRDLGAAELPKAKDYIWGDQNIALSWSGNKTKPYSGQGLTAGLLHQIFHNLFCSYGLTRIHRRQRCADNNMTGDKIHQTPT